MDKINKKPIKKTKQNNTTKNIDHYSTWQNKQSGFKMKKQQKAEKNARNSRSIENYLLNLIKNLQNQRKTTLDDLKSAETQTDAAKYSQNFTQTSDNEQDDF